MIINFILFSVFLLADFCFANAQQKLRVISLAPSTTEILFALGLDDEIVGVSQFCNYPSATMTKEKIGTFSNPNIEKILWLKPDIVFCTGLEQTPVIAKLRQLNFKVYISDPRNFQELFNSIKEIGGLINRESQAAVLINGMKSDLDKIITKENLMPYKKRPKIFFEIWHSPLMTVGRGSFVDELLSLAGGINIAHDVKRPYSYFSSEQVIKQNPDCIILAYMSGEAPSKMIGARFGWKNISAVKNKHIYNDINPDLLLRPGPRLVEGLKEIQKRLYP